MRVETRKFPRTGLVMAGAAMALAACQPAAEVVEPVPSALSEPLLPSGPALEQREPDTCGAHEFIPYLTQPASALDAAEITGPYRVIEWRGIITQEYVPERISFRLDPQGNIYNIDCG